LTTSCHRSAHAAFSCRCWCSPNGEEQEFEIIAGRRRYFASKAIAKETGETCVSPCRILSAGDDAGAIEASILENVARLEPDEMQQFEAFKLLVDKGRAIDEIANIFGVTELTVKRRLALANLIPVIRKAYAQDELDGASIMALTLASGAKQREWFAMFEDARAYAPRGRDSKRWLLGGGEIATGVALFSLDSYEGDIFEDLFGERSVFADAEKFWRHQDAAIEAAREKLVTNGWTKVTVLECGAFFSKWDYVEASKKPAARFLLRCAIPIDMGAWWRPDDAFFDLLRDKKTVKALLGDIAGKAVANVNRDATAKTQKQIIRDTVGGKNGRDAKPAWRPRWMAFPVRSYRKAGAPGAVQRTVKIAALFKR